MNTRIFKSDDFFQLTKDVPIRSIITQSKDATVVAWILTPGQKIELHIHPNGQDTWYILTGNGEYFMNLTDAPTRINTGDVVVAKSGEIHGVINSGSETLRIISVVAPLDAGFQPVP